MSLNAASAKPAVKPRSDSRRVLDEMMEMANALQSHELISRQDMAKMKLLCEAPPEYSPERVTAIRVSKAKVSQSVLASMLNVSVSAVQKWESPSSGKRPSGAAAKLLQLIESRGLEAIVV
jgi:putative transcriptional regulator